MARSRWACKRFYGFFCLKFNLLCVCVCVLVDSFYCFSHVIFQMGVLQIVEMLLERSVNPDVVNRYKQVSFFMLVWWLL